MIRSAALGWLLSVVFAAIAGYYAWRTVRAAGGGRPTKPDRISCAVHAAMSAGMVPMLWWWGMELPALPQVALFGFGALWFLTLAGGDPRQASCALQGHRGPLGLRLYHVHHAVLMVAMVWMVALMSVPALAPMSMSAAPAPAGGAMAGMDHGAAGGLPVAGGHAPGGPPAAAVALSLVLAAYFLLLVPWFLRELVAARRDTAGLVRAGEPAGLAARVARRAAMTEAAVHAAKCAGMGVMLLAVV